jgi:hypothetical protein
MIIKRTLFKKGIILSLVTFTPYILKCTVNITTYYFNKVSGISFIAKTLFYYLKNLRQ